MSNDHGYLFPKRKRTPQASRYSRLVRQRSLRHSRMNARASQRRKFIVGIGLSFLLILLTWTLTYSFHFSTVISTIITVLALLFISFSGYIIDTIDKATERDIDALEKLNRAISREQKNMRHGGVAGMARAHKYASQRSYITQEKEEFSSPTQSERIILDFPVHARTATPHEHHTSTHSGTFVSSHPQAHRHLSSASLTTNRNTDGEHSPSVHSAPASATSPYSADVPTSTFSSSQRTKQVAPRRKVKPLQLEPYATAPVPYRPKRLGEYIHTDSSITIDNDSTYVHDAHLEGGSILDSLLERRRA
ncbi:MAG: hypothetical protein J6M18_01560 [Actinomycetaceae bacterium]|nr:hypothetical protein [Actinomycetaceae bacterium]